MDEFTNKQEELKYAEKTSTVFCWITIITWAVSILGIFASIIFMNLYICFGSGMLFAFIGMPSYVIFRNWVEKEVAFRKEIKAIETAKNS